MAALLVGRDGPATRQLQAALGIAEFLALPTLDEPAEGSWAWTWREGLERWESASIGSDQFSAVVVCCWDDLEPAAQFVDLSVAAWLAQVERRVALWMVAMKVGVARCAAGGSVVVVVERPTALDAVGRSALVGAAEGMLSLTRCLAASEGPRGVRVNAVATELWTVPEELLGPAPALRTFPGRIESEVAGAVALLLSEDAVGVTGSVTTPDGGRAA